MLDLSPTTVRILNIGTAMFMVAVVLAVVFSRPNTAVAAKKPAVEAEAPPDLNDRAIVTISSAAVGEAVAKH